MRGENNAEQPERTYAYYRCGGKCEDDGEGGKHRVCSGHVFTLETKMSYCPACGEPLKTLISKQEAPEAITCALEKCLSCKNRERSVAVNDERCLGGTGYKDGKERKVLGSQICNGCLCKVCCQEIIEDADAVKKYGLGRVVQAQVQLRATARRALGSESGEEREKLFVELRAGNAVLSDIRYETFSRWGMSAYNAVEKELAWEAKAKRAGRQSGNGARRESGRERLALPEPQAAVRA